MKCIYPNNILIIGNDGNTISCPLERGNVVLGNLSEGIRNTWNNQNYKNFRNNLQSYLEDPQKVCWQCGLIEKNGGTSLRTETPVLDQSPTLKAIQFKLSNRCQLVCAHCGPLLSSSWGKFLGKKDYIQQFDISEEILDELCDIVPTLKYIRFTGGEPWMDPMHWKILERLSKVDTKDCELHYITNGLVNKNKIKFWENWKTISIRLSVDGYGDVYNWFRRKADWNELVRSYEILSSMPNTNMIINYSLTPWTVDTIDMTKQFFDTKLDVVPIMDPAHASIASIDKQEYKRLGLSHYDTYENIIGARTKPIINLKTWATSWDNRWNTNGQAEKLFPWLKLIE